MGTNSQRREIEIIEEMIDYLLSQYIKISRGVGIITPIGKQYIEGKKEAIREVLDIIREVKSYEAR